LTALTFEEIRKLVQLQLGKRDVREDDRLVEDLGAESADVANLVATVEEKFQVTIKEAEIAYIYTPADLFELVKNRQHGS